MLVQTTIKIDVLLELFVYPYRDGTLSALFSSFSLFYSVSIRLIYVLLVKKAQKVHKLIVAIVVWFHDYCSSRLMKNCYVLNCSQIINHLANLPLNSIT